jgi:hypothetical protein
MTSVRRWLDSLEASPRLLLVFFLFPLQLMVLLPVALGPKDWAPLFASISVALWLIWFVVLFVMVTPASDQWLRAHSKPLKWIALSLCLVVCLVGILEVTGINLLQTGKLRAESSGLKTASKYLHEFGYNDGTAMVHRAAEDLIKGKNPYASANIFEAVAEFGVSLSKVTPLRQGDFADTWPYPTHEEIDRVWQEAKADAKNTALEFESKLSYPAGSFLFVSPFVALGLKDLRYFYLLCVLLVFVVIMWQTPKRLWPLVILVALASLDLWNDVAGGGTAGLYLLFLVLGWILLKKNIWASAAFMGLAATSKQLAWFFVLFYLILILRTIGWKRFFQVAAVIGAILLVTNLPFIIGGPLTWLRSVLAPMVDPMFPEGVGIVSFSIAGLGPSGMGMVYTIMEVVVLVACLTWYYYKCGKYPDAGMALAVLPFLFAWRSFSMYMSSAGILVFATALIAHGRSALSPATADTDAGGEMPIHEQT